MELNESARELGIADHFRLFGFRRDVPDLMRAIDVMCLPSRREPFGLVYVEAALAEKPVIGCDAGGAPEIIRHGETGLLVAAPKGRLAEQSASNIEDLAEAILTLLDDRNRAAEMGRRGRQAALDRFSWAQYLARLTELYGHILGGHHAHARRAA
jgi:glycosyltransferase involved in cell wall biosynthesis